MKKILICGITAIFSIIISFTSCKKDSSIYQPLTGEDAGSGNPVIPDSDLLEIGNWITIPNTGVYTATVGPINIPPGSSATHFTISVVGGGRELLINNPVDFMGGSIWCIFENATVKIVFRNTSGKVDRPFDSLEIKISFV